MISNFFFTKRRVLKTVPLFRGWKLIKEESDWEYAKRIAGLKEIKLNWEVNNEDNMESSSTG